MFSLLRHSLLNHSRYSTFARGKFYSKKIDNTKQIDPLTIWNKSVSWDMNFRFDRDRKFRYFNISNFGEDYTVSKTQIKRIKELECRIYEENEIKKELDDARYQALNHQILQPYSIYKCLNEIKLYMNKTSYSTISSIVEPNDAEYKVSIEEFNHGISASSPGRRPFMNDRYLFKKFNLHINGNEHNVILTGIMDGHCGNGCSNYIAEHLVSMLRFYIEKLNPLELTDHGMVNALLLTFVALSHEYNSKNPLYDKSYNGASATTANIAIQMDDVLWVANAGDSRALLIDKNSQFHQLSYDVSPNEPRHRLRDKEGTNKFFSYPLFQKYYGRRATGGALGKHWGNGKYSSRPDVVKITSQEIGGFSGSTLIQCSNGITQVASTAEIASRYLSLSKQHELLTDIAHDMVNAAYMCGSDDNLSLLIRNLEI